MRHVQGSENIIADTLSRIEIDSITNSSNLNFKEFALAQKNYPEVKEFLQNDGSSLKLELKLCQTSECNFKGLPYSIRDPWTGLPQPVVHLLSGDL
ncbi:transposon Ty3-G Gag-Pol polyprotein [Trichonephila clavipes]|uniref:Transposon Ty3-G Gag-Pol polyprotein n=1 Tax=Trichonephila clavipes TaxID=2585209 RepID=A0A8X6WJJ4_TRICX|nr:transposon Ty3-G Gag-Pol polyprotein [Trichonephila clavipes]